MFPHTITIYRHSIVSGADSYSMQVVSGFYCYGSEGASPSGRGSAEADTLVAVSSPATAEGYGTDWTAQPGDRIIKGTGSSITKWADIPTAKTVFSVTADVIGSDVDNVTISAR